MDAAIFEVENLAKAKGEFFNAFIIINKATGNADRGLVGVVQAVVAGKAGIAK